MVSDHQAVLMMIDIRQLKKGKSADSYFPKYIISHTNNNKIVFEQTIREKIFSENQGFGAGAGS